MAKSYTVGSLIESVKLRCRTPMSQITYKESDITAMADDEMKSVIVPLIMRAREEYFVKHEDFTVPGDGVIEIPGDAVGIKLRAVCLLTQSSPEVLINLPRLQIESIAGVQSGLGAFVTGFYIEGNKLRLRYMANFPVGRRVRLYYFKRNLSLADPSQYGQIKEIDVGSNTIRLDKVPRSWVIGDKVTAVSQYPTFDETMPEPATIVNTSSPSLVLSSVAGLAVGDYVSLDGYTAIPQLPIEAMSYLAQLVTVRVLEGLGDGAGMARAESRLPQLREDFLTVISNRVDGSPKKILPPNGGVRSASSIRPYRRGGWGY